MKKVVGVFVLAVALNIGYFNFSTAQEEYQCEYMHGQRVCLAKEIMGELVKETIYHVGSKVLDKMKNNEIHTTSSSSSTNSSNSSNYSNYVDNSTNSNSQNVQEEMIPI